MMAAPQCYSSHPIVAVKESFQFDCNEVNFQIAMIWILGNGFSIFIFYFLTHLMGDESKSIMTFLILFNTTLIPTLYMIRKNRIKRLRVHQFTFLCGMG